MAAPSLSLPTAGTEKKKKKLKLQGLKLNTTQALDNVPVKVTDKLYFGSLHAAFNEEGLVERNITHVLNLSGMQPTFASKFAYLNVDIKDKDSSDILSVIPPSLIFISAGMRAGGTFVHCVGGRSRSSSVVIAWLMSQYGCSYEEGFSYLKGMRSVVEPNKGFELQLRAYREARYHIYSAQQILLFRKLAAAATVKRRRNDARAVSVKHAEFQGTTLPVEAAPVAAMDVPGSTALPQAAPIAQASSPPSVLRRMHTAAGTLLIKPGPTPPLALGSGGAPSPTALPRHPPAPGAGGSPGSSPHAGGGLSARSLGSGSEVGGLCRSVVATMALTSVDLAVATVRRMAYFTLSRPGQTRAVVIPPLMGMQWRFRCDACAQPLFLASSVVRPSKASEAAQWAGEGQESPRPDRPMTARAATRAQTVTSPVHPLRTSRARTGSGGHGTAAIAAMVAGATTPSLVPTSPGSDAGSAHPVTLSPPSAGRRASGGGTGTPAPSLSLPTGPGLDTTLSPVKETSGLGSASPAPAPAPALDLSGSGDALGALLAAGPRSVPVTPRTAAAARVVAGGGPRTPLAGAGAVLMGAPPVTPRGQGTRASTAADATRTPTLGSMSARTGRPASSADAEGGTLPESASFRTTGGLTLEPDAAAPAPSLGVSLSPVPAWAESTAPVAGRRASGGGVPPSTRGKLVGGFSFGGQDEEEEEGGGDGEDFDPWALAEDGAPLTPSAVKRHRGFGFAPPPSAVTGPKDVFGKAVATAPPTDYSKRSGWKSTVVFDRGEEWKDEDKRKVGDAVGAPDAESYRQRLALLAALTTGEGEGGAGEGEDGAAAALEGAGVASTAVTPLSSSGGEATFPALTKRKRPSTASRRRVSNTEAVVAADLEASSFAVGGDLVFLEPLDWMGEMSGQMGKLHCPGCKTALGFYDWAGAVVGSTCRVSPAFCVYSSAVWVQKPSAVEEHTLAPLPADPAAVAAAAASGAVPDPTIAMEGGVPALSTLLAPPSSPVPAVPTSGGGLTLAMPPLSTG